MELGVHLPLMPFGEEPLSLARVRRVVETARGCGFAAVSANDHFVFQTPWLDGPTALASVIDASGDLTLATTVALSALRGPVALAKALAAIDILSGGRLVAGVGPGSSPRDYAAVGVPFDERWKRFEESVVVLRALLAGAPVPSSDLVLEPVPARPVPLWIGSWGVAGLGQLHRPRPALDERQADLALECRDMLAHRRLREPQRHRGAGEGAVRGDLGEHAEASHVEHQWDL